MSAEGPQQNPLQQGETTSMAHRRLAQEQDDEQAAMEEDEEDEEKGSGGKRGRGGRGGRGRRRGGSGTGNGTGGGGGTAKYVRYTTEQVEVLEAIYRECPKPSSVRRVQIIKEFPVLSNIEARQIKVWFQNRR